MSTQAPTSPPVTMYEQMRRIRAFEDKTVALFQEGAVPGFTHTYIGQEAVAVGVCSALRRSDRVASNHRGHGHLIAKGADTARMMAEMLGRTDGYCRGMGGEMHIVDPAVGLLGANGIVGAGIPIAVGAALADNLAGNDNVTVVFFGDGATSEGYFAEALNLAAIWQLPVVFVCENNLYGEYSAAADVCAGKLHERGVGHGIPGVEIDGQDVLAVNAVAVEAVDRARAGGGPTLIEAKTYRYHGHNYGEEIIIGSYKYRSDEEIDHWRTHRDPLVLCRRRCLEEGRADAARLDQIDAAIIEEIERAAEFAQQAPLPSPEQAFEFMFVNPVTRPGQRS